MYRDAFWRGGPVLMSALSGVESCLLDIKAKALGVPVYDLLGGRVRDEVPVYANGWFSGAKTPQEFAIKAQDAIDSGFKAIKWDPFGSSYMTISNSELTSALNCIAAVKDVTGQKIDIIIEGHGRFNVPTAINIAKRIEEFDPKWFEEPVPPSPYALRQVRKQSPVRIATGERLHDLQSFIDLFDNEAVDYVQPDISHVGGLINSLAIAELANQYYIPFAPHNPNGPIATAANLQLAACSPNFDVLEIMRSSVPWRKEIVDETIDFKDGYIKIPTKPGLGIDIHEEELTKHPYREHDLRHYNGMLTDIRPPKMIDVF
jgi:galactonate dehydratase